MRATANFGRREWLAGLTACLGSGIARTSFAGAAHPISLADLVQRSRFAVVAIAREATGTWEADRSGRRIVTYTRVEVQQALDNHPPPDSQMYVRTLGGSVGEIGQIVHGEARLGLDQPCVLFLHDGVNGAWSVTELAQGHYPLLEDEERTPRLQVSPRLGDLTIRDPYCAVCQLRGKSLSDCERLVRQERQRHE